MSKISKGTSMKRYGDNSTVIEYDKTSKFIVQPIGDQMFIWRTKEDFALKYERIAPGYYTRTDGVDCYEFTYDLELEEAYIKHITDDFIKEIQVSE